ncbi:MAG: GNAT family N-acetyltransferase [Actinomycetales bacterium]
MKLHLPVLDEIPGIAKIWRDSLDQSNGWHHFRKMQIEKMENDPTGYLASLDDLTGGDDLTLEDGSIVKRLPSVTRFMWQDGPVGVISFRWQPGTPELPPHVLGHIGYETFHFARGKGYATSALSQVLQFPRDLELPYVELTPDKENSISQRVILANSGHFIEEFAKPESSGGGRGFRYRITL